MSAATMPTRPSNGGINKTFIWNPFLKRAFYQIIIKKTYLNTIYYKYFYPATLQNLQRYKQLQHHQLHLQMFLTYQEFCLLPI